MLSTVLLLMLVFLPQCECADIIYHIDEEKAPGTYVGDIAQDSGILNSVSSEYHKHIRFNSLELNGKQLFNVSEKAGKLYTAQLLDAESLCNRNAECFQTTEIAIRKQGGVMKIVIIKVVLEDINDNEPEFPHDRISIQFPENDPKSKRYIPNAVDRDIGIKNSKITYKLRNNDKKRFQLSVSEITSRISRLGIFVVTSLDREEKSSYTIQVVATDQGSPSKEAVLDVDISVTDINDNAPIFTQSNYSVSIYSEVKSDSPVITLSATDMDEGSNGEVSYLLSNMTSDKVKRHFEVNAKSGEIFLSRKFKSGRSSKYELIVEARDGSILPLGSIAIVQVNVIDTTNNPPSIIVNFVSASSDELTEIPEDAAIDSVLAYVSVIDNDSGKNGEVTCNIKHTNFYLHDLEAMNYSMNVKDILDRENQEQHRVTLVCHDRGTPPLFSRINFIIYVTDVNDNAPIFQSAKYVVSLSENNNVGVPIAIVVADDLDSGENGRIEYFLDSSLNSSFVVDASSGIITVKTVFDRELITWIKLNIFARDFGNPSLTGSTVLNIDIVDQNDVQPIFSTKLFSFKVNENLPSEFPVGLINSTDLDLGQGGELVYSLHPNDTEYFPFQISDIGLILTTEKLDFESEMIYKFQVVARDNGNPSLENCADVVVEVIDENDNEPVFHFPRPEQFTMMVRYSQFTHDNILTLRAVDSDSGQNAVLKYNIFEGNDNQLFDVNSITGVLSFARLPNDDDAGTYDIVFIVQDNGSPILSGMTNISLTVIVRNETSTMANLELFPEDKTENTVILIIILVYLTVFICCVIIIVVYIRKQNNCKNSNRNGIRSCGKYTGKLKIAEPLPHETMNDLEKYQLKESQKKLNSSHLEMEKEFASDVQEVAAIRSDGVNIPKATVIVCPPNDDIECGGLSQEEESSVRSNCSDNVDKTEEAVETSECEMGDERAVSDGAQPVSNEQSLIEQQCPVDDKALVLTPTKRGKMFDYKESPV